MASGELSGKEDMTIGLVRAGSIPDQGRPCRKGHHFSSKRCGDRQARRGDQALDARWSLNEISTRRIRKIDIEAKTASLFKEWLSCRIEGLTEPGGSALRQSIWNGFRKQKGCFPGNAMAIFGQPSI
jgi:hypothetical protein